MRFINLYMSEALPGKRYVKAEVEVPGLGNLTLQDCLSAETFERVKREIEAATRERLTGQLAPAGE